MRLATALSALVLACGMPVAACANAALASTAPATAAETATVAPSAAQSMQSMNGLTMGTTWSVRLQADAAAIPDLQRDVQAQLDLVVAQMSTWERGSDLSRFNRAAAGTRQPLPPEMRQVMDAALALARDTGGAFDPTVGALVNLWGFGPDGERRAPDAALLDRTMTRVGWQRLKLDASGVMTQPGDIYVDLSGIAKGYAVDQVTRYLLAQEVSAFLVEVGGELRSHGHKPDGTPWRIAVEQPTPADFNERAAAAQAVVALDGMAMATSGDYRHFLAEDGRRYSHTIDPRNGQPVSHGLASVSVLHAECMHADALATALTVLGPAQGWDYARRRKLAAFFVWHDGDGFKTRMTPQFRAALSPP